MNAIALAMRAPSPRVRGEGRDEGASPLGAELRRSESRRGPLTLVRYAHSTSPRTRGEVNASFLIPARALACGAPDLSHMKREAGAKRTARGGWPRCLSSLFPFRQNHKGYGTPEDAGPTSAPWGAALPPPCPSPACGGGNGRGQLAFRRSTTALPKGCVVPWCDPGQVSWANRPRGGGHSADGSPHFQRRTSHAGRNAGRHDARTARERVTSPPAGSASRPAAAVCLRGGVLHGRDDLLNM